MKILHVATMHGTNGFTKALQSVCDEYQEIPVAHPHLNAEIQKVKDADLVFIQIQQEGISNETLEFLKSHGSFIINWSGDVRSPLPEFYLRMAKYCDLTCFSNMNDVETMREHGFKSSYLQIGFDETIYKPDGEKYDVPEIIFMGNNFDHFPLSKFRKEMVEFLQAVYGSRFGVYGYGWPGGNGCYMGDQYGEACAYRGAKIGINLSHFDYKRYTSDRMFRMLGCGIMVITHKYQQIETDFINGNSVGYWDNFMYLQRDIDYYLSIQGSPNRFDIAKSGQQLAVNNFTFTSMAENIIKLYNDGKAI